jgi:hypothetical protein
MYEDNLKNGASAPTQQPEHLSVAVGFANEMIARFSADEQNEIVKQIRISFSDSRNQSIMESEKHIAYLRNSLERL